MVDAESLIPQVQRVVPRIITAFGPAGAEKKPKARKKRTVEPWYKTIMKHQWALCLTSGMTFAIICGTALAQPGAKLPGSGWTSLQASGDPKTKRIVAEISKLKWWQACGAWGREYRSGKSSDRENALYELLKWQELLNDKDRSHVGDRSVDIGMTMCGVFAAKGIPDTVNRTTTTNGTTEQLVYRPNMYVYTEPSPGSRVNIVRAIQN